MCIMKQIDLTSSLDIQNWKLKMPYLTSFFIEMAYAFINKIAMETWSVKQIYYLFVEKVQWILY